MEKLLHDRLKAHNQYQTFQIIGNEKIKLTSNEADALAYVIEREYVPSYVYEKLVDLLMEKEQGYCVDEDELKNLMGWR